jgi:hypothetical protein
MRAQAAATRAAAAARMHNGGAAETGGGAPQRGPTLLLAPPHLEQPAVHVVTQQLAHVALGDAGQHAAGRRLSGRGGADAKHGRQDQAQQGT